MRNVLADLAIESEAATLLAFRVARSFDARETDDQERAFCRIATAIAKYWLCKRSPVHVGEALECLGGNGYVEESVMPRLYREAPLYSIWEGSGNVICLDVLRALAKDRTTVEALLAELKSVGGADKRVERYAAEVERLLPAKDGSQTQHGDGATDYSARDLTERLALALQAVLVVRHSSPVVAEAFLASRLAGQHGQTFGTLPADVDVGAVLKDVAEALSIDK